MSLRVTTADFIITQAQRGFQMADDGVTLQASASGKRSRKSACPKRILQNSCETTEDVDAAQASPADHDNDKDCDEDPPSSGKRRRQLESPAPAQEQRQTDQKPTLTPTPPPTPPPRAPAVPAPMPADDGGTDLLRSLATLSPQALIPSLYTAFGGGAGGYGGFGGFGGLGDPRRPRGRPKGSGAGGAAPLLSGGGSFSLKAPHQQAGPQLAPRLGRGPRPFDPHAALQPVRIITRKGVAYNRRPRSFYSAEIKLSVIEFAEQHGASAAERHFNIPLSTVQSWMRHDNKARILRAPYEPQFATFAPAPAPVPAASSPVVAAAVAPAARPPPPSDEQPLNLVAQDRIPLPSNR